MKRTLLAISLLLALGQAAFAEPPQGEPTQRRTTTQVFIWTITPYGDFCPKCSNYGAGHQKVMDEQAIDAARSYFSARGFDIANIKLRGRFILFDVVRQRQLVDQVIFDRATGRLRSIH